MSIVVIVSAIAAYVLWLGATSAMVSAIDSSPAESIEVTVPALEAGTAWVLKDSVRCDGRSIVLTRNINTKKERDSRETAQDAITMELERQVTVNAGDGLEGSVTYSTAVMKTKAGATASPLPVQGKTFGFAAKGGSPGEFIKAESGGQDSAAIAANDRLGQLLASRGASALATADSGVLITPAIWSIISGNYLGTPARLQCRVIRSAGAIVELECPADFGVEGAGVINARLHIDEAARRLESAEITSRRAKESVNRAATPDDEVVVKSIRECSVRTAQVPFSAPPAN